MLKRALCDAKVNCAASATETSDMYSQMEHISEILTQEEENKWGNAKNIYHFAWTSHT